MKRIIKKATALVYYVWNKYIINNEGMQGWFSAGQAL